MIYNIVEKYGVKFALPIGDYRTEELLYIEAKKILIKRFFRKLCRQISIIKSVIFDIVEI